MGPALVIETKTFAIELYSLLKELDPARWKAEKKQNIKLKILSLENEVNRLYSELHEFHSKVQKQRHSLAISERLHNLRELLSELKTSLIEDIIPKEYFHSLRKRIEVGYQELALTLENYSVKLPQIRPTNYARYAFHILSGLFTLFCIEMVPSPIYLIFLAMTFCLSFWGMEIIRVKSGKIKEILRNFFHPVAHPHEDYKINSSSWYTTALVMLSLTQSITLSAIGVTVLAFSDPAAAAIGRKFGRIKLPGGRSLEGSLGFFLVGTLSVFILLSKFHPLYTNWQMLIVAACAGLFGAVGELFGSFLDDNFTIPVCSATGAFIALSLI
jgi:dolichol kinase